MSVAELIDVGDQFPASAGPSIAVQYHECAHILQYRAYGYSSAAFNKAMNLIYPRGGSNTFAKGASLEDPSGLFNSSLEGSTRRAIDFSEGDQLEQEALKALIRAAVALNTSKASG